MTKFSDAGHIDPRRESDTTHRVTAHQRELNDDENFSVIASVRKVRETEFADEKDRAIFTLYERCTKFRRALEQIASYPRISQPEEIAVKALDWPGIRLGGKFQMPNTEMEAAVNKGLAVTHLSGLPTGARVMREEGVPLEVGLRVLLHPETRRTTDWSDASGVLSTGSANPPTYRDRRDQ